MFKGKQTFLSVLLVIIGTGTATGSQSLKQSTNEKVYRGKDVTVTVTHYPANRTAQGRVPKTISILSPGFEEIDVDSQGTGVADSKEFISPVYDVLFSEPTEQGYLNLSVQKRVTSGKHRGITEAKFVLTQDGRNYQLYQESFSPFSKYGDSTPCTSLAGNTLDISGGVSAEVFDVLKSGTELDDSCRVPPFSGDQWAITDGITNVMSSSKGPRTDGLSCLMNHNLGRYAAKIEHEMDDLTSKAKIHEPLVQCSEGIFGQLGEYNDETGKITLNPNPNSSVANVGAGLQGASKNYEAVFFHESLHKAGIKDEPTVVHIVACCINADSAACKQVDDEVKGEANVSAHLQAYTRELPGFSEISREITRVGGAAKASGFFDNYFQNLGTVKGQVLKDYSACAAKNPTNIEKVCTPPLLASIQKGLDDFTHTTCKLKFGSQVDSQGKSVCESFDSEMFTVLRDSIEKRCPEPGSNKPASGLRGSCLFSAELDANGIDSSIIQMKGRRSNFLFDASISSGDVTSPSDKATVDSFVSAINKNVGPWIMKDWNTLEESMSSPTLVRIFADYYNSIALDQKIKNGENNLPSKIKACEQKSTPAECGKMIEQGMEATTAKKIMDLCQQDNNSLDQLASKQCTQMSNELTTLIRKSVDASQTKSGGCKMKPIAELAALDIPGYNFTCLYQAMRDSQDCKLNPKVPNCVKVSMRSLDITAEGKKLAAAQEASSGPTTAAQIHNPSGFIAIHFDPDKLAVGEPATGDNTSTLGDQVAQAIAQGPERKFVQNPVASAMSFIGIPDATAATNNPLPSSATDIPNPSYVENSPNKPVYSAPQSTQASFSTAGPATQAQRAAAVSYAVIAPLSPSQASPSQAQSIDSSLPSQAQVITPRSSASMGNAQPASAPVLVAQLPPIASPQGQDSTQFNDPVPRSPATKGQATHFSSALPSGGANAGAATGPVSSLVASASATGAAADGFAGRSPASAPSTSHWVMNHIQEDPDLALAEIRKGQLDQALSDSHFVVYDDLQIAHPKGFSKSSPGAQCVLTWSQNQHSFKSLSPERKECAP